VLLHWQGVLELSKGIRLLRHLSAEYTAIEVILDEKERIEAEKKKNFKIRIKSVIELLQETYYPGHATTAKRVIERHLIREFGLKPREATYHGGNIIDELQTMGLLERVPEDVIRNALLTINIRRLQAYKP
tara:strand:- start:2097 stop:2489 length:393 start_codon:yes stop_codon:yes gene_type:complete